MATARPLLSSAMATGNSNNLSESTKQNMQQTPTDPTQLQSVNSDDSSVFSGLGSIFNDRLDENDENKSVRSVRFADEDVRQESRRLKTKSALKKHSSIGKYKLQKSQDGDGTQDEGISVIRSKGTDEGSQRSAFRNMHQTADEDYVFEKGSNRKAPYGSDTESLYGNDASTISFGSVNDFPRPRGSMKLVSNLQIFGDATGDDDGAGLSTPEGAEGITNVLKEFEKEMDANISSLIANDEDGDYVAMSEWEDIVPRQVKSEDSHHKVTQHQAKQMQRVLHQARQEVETLRDNNEQFLSEIEQTEEEHKSQKKLLDEQMKQKLAELKAMYQDEIDSVIQEKDAAIVEASKQASRYADSGRKQIAQLKKQLERLRRHANGAVKKAVQEAAVTVKTKKDTEIAERLGALRKSYETELEKTRNETETKVRNAVNEAIAELTKTMMADKDREVNEAIQGTKLESLMTGSLGFSIQEVAELKKEKEGICKALESVKCNFETNYPEKMEALREKQKETSNPMRLLHTDLSSKTESEKLLREVLEAFSFLVEKTEVERADVYSVARNDLIQERQAEIDDYEKQLAEYKDRIERLELSLRTTSREKRALQERYRRDQDTHRLDIQRLQKRIEELTPPTPPPPEPIECQEEEEVSVQMTHFAPDSRSSALIAALKKDRQIRRSITSRRGPHFRSQKITSEARDNVEQARSPSSTVQGGRQSPEKLAPSHEVTIIPSPSPPPLPPPVDSDSVTGNGSLNEAFDAVTVTSSRETIDISIDPGLEMSFSELKPAANDISIDDNGSVNKHNPERTDKKLGILNSFKSPEMTRKPSDLPKASPETESTTEKDSSILQKEGTVQKFRNLFDNIGRGRSSHVRRESLTDDSTSILKADVGINSPSSPGRNGIERSKSFDEAQAAGKIKRLSLEYTKSEHIRSTFRKKMNPLGMFASRKETRLDEDVSNLDGMKNSSDDKNIFQTESSDIIEENRSSDNSSWHSKKPPLPGFDNSKPKMAASPHVINGKKPPLPEWSSSGTSEIFKADSDPNPSPLENCDSEGDSANSFNEEPEHKTMGHVMCLSRFAVSKKSGHQGLNCSKGAAPKGASAVSSDSTMSTAMSTDDEARDSVSQNQKAMRKFPPLGDQSDDDSADESIDKYERFDPPAQFAQEYPSPSECRQVPMIVSRSADDGSPVIYMDSSSDSKPVVVQGQHISRKPAFSAFTPRQSNVSDNAGSEATTTITAHTFRSSFNTDRVRDFEDRETPTSSSRGARPRRYTLAAIKARRSQRLAEF